MLSIVKFILFIAFMSEAVLAQAESISVKTSFNNIDISLTSEEVSISSIEVSEKRKITSCNKRFYKEIFESAKEKINDSKNISYSANQGVSLSYKINESKVEIINYKTSLAKSLMHLPYNYIQATVIEGIRCKK